MVPVKTILRLVFAVFSVMVALPAFAQNTGLFVDGPRLDAPSGRRQITLTPADATFTASRNFQGGVTIRLNGPSTSWTLDFSAGTGIALAAGQYLHATWSLSTPFVGLRISGDFVSCGDLSGRFVIHEVVYGSDGTVLKFAADAEQHCNDLAEATFAAIRYDSGVADLNPFGGDYPRYELNLTEPTNGVITGIGLNCGGGAVACAFDSLAPQIATLVATPAPGFIFNGWRGGCSGGERTTIYVNSVKSCTADFAPAIPQAVRNYFVAISEPGERVGAGTTHVFSSSNSVWRASPINGSIIGLTIDSPGVSAVTRWHMQLAGPNGQPLAPGTYDPIVTTSSSGHLASLRVSSENGSTCETTGRMVIYEITSLGGVLGRLSADAEFHCGASVPGLFVAIRYQTEMAEVRPFAGNYPDYTLRLDAPAFGTITGPGVNCGAGGTACEWTGVAGVTVPLTATPAPGYVFAGWGGSCSGGPVTTVVVNMPKTCRASFLSQVPSTPQTLLVGQSTPGDPIAGGASTAHAADNSAWQVSYLENGRRIRVVVAYGLRAEWEIDMRAPLGHQLAVGTYLNARSAGVHDFAGLSIEAYNRSCFQSIGRFVIYELSVSNGQVTSLAADVEQHCDDEAPALVMAIRYNSLYGEQRPFAGSFPRYELLITPSPNGSVTGPGISCGGGTGSACSVVHLSPTTLSLTATPSTGFIFVGWMGGCTGGPSTTIVVNSVKGCEARFEPLVPISPRTLAVFSAETGHEALNGETRVYSAVNSQWEIDRLSNGSLVWLRIRAFEGINSAFWSLQLQSASGSPLQLGTYQVPGGFSDGTARMSVFGVNGGCTGVGSFTIRELQTDQNGEITRFAADVNHRCSTTDGPRLVGRIQYQSNIDVVAHRSPHDINGDGRLDLFWQHERDGWIAAWEMQGTRLLTARLTTPSRVSDTNWRIIGTADFNADGRPDLFWQNRQTGALAVWYMDGTTYLGPGVLSTSTVSDLNWQIRAIADFNGDSRPDLLWQHQGTGALAVWILDGVRLVESRPMTPSAVTDTNWKVAGAADFNGDGHSDLFWRNQATGVMVVWYLNGTSFAGSAIVLPNVADLDWEIRALADINDDGSPDIVWQRRSTGSLSAWLMNGVQFLTGAGFQPALLDDPAWRIVGPR